MDSFKYKCNGGHIPTLIFHILCIPGAFREAGYCLETGPVSKPIEIRCELYCDIEPCGLPPIYLAKLSYLSEGRINFNYKANIGVASHTSPVCSTTDYFGMASALLKLIEQFGLGPFR